MAMQTGHRIQARSLRKKTPELSDRRHEGCGPWSGNVTKVGKTKIPGAEDRKGPEIKVRAG